MLSRRKSIAVCIARFCATSLLAGTSAAALAQDAAPGRPFLSLLLPLLVVLGSLLAALVWLNRSRGLYKNEGPLKVVQVLPVSPRERIVVLETQSKLMVIGVATGRVTLLSMLDSTESKHPLP